jgi:hypothetical protein
VDVQVDVPNQAEVPHTKANKILWSSMELSPLLCIFAYYNIAMITSAERRVHHNIATMHRGEADLTSCVEETKVPVNGHPGLDNLLTTSDLCEPCVELSSYLIQTR